MASSGFLAVCVCIAFQNDIFKFLGSGSSRERNELHILRKEISKNLSISEVPQIRFSEEASLRRVVKELRLSVVRVEP